MYEDKTYENIKENILSNINDLDKREGSFMSDMVSPVSIELEGVYQNFNTMLGIMFLIDATGEYLEKKASEYGVIRKQGTYSEGQVVFTGEENAVIPKGSLVSTDTNLLFETTEESIILIATTEITVSIKALEVGSKYNVLANTIKNIPVSINGITGITNTAETLGGTDIETDEELLNRTLIQIQNPATSGNVMHYKLWSLEVNGVGDAKVFPLHNGPGTVMVMPVSSEKMSLDANIIDNIINNIEEKRPVGATVTVESPTEVLINTTAQIVIDSDFTLQQVTEEYTSKFNEYIKSSVFKIYTVDYYKCLSLMYEIEGIKQVLDFKLNNSNANISIQETEIQVPGTINLEV